MKRKRVFGDLPIEIVTFDETAEKLAVGKIIRWSPMLPPRFQRLHAEFDAVSNRALYSREPLQRFWSNTVEQLRGMRIWNIDLPKLTINLFKDFSLTTSFAFTYLAARGPNNRFCPILSQRMGKI